MIGLAAILLGPWALGGFLVFGVLAQIVATVRLGPSGAWIARRWTLWAICLYGTAILLMLDVADLAWGGAGNVLSDASKTRALASALLAYIGASLIILTITGGLIAGTKRLALRS